MPELPDVETFKRYIDSTALHQKISGLEVKDKQVVGPVSFDDLEQALAGYTLERTRRHGKYLFVQINSGRWLLMHFGMTGRLKYFKNPDTDPEYDQLRINFSDGYHLAYVSPRKLGEVSLVEDVDEFLKEQQLGPDALDADFDWAAFEEAFAGRRGMLKPALMNQHIMAGVGNVYSDEIMFQMRLHPRTQISALDSDTLKEVYQTMHRVLEMAIDRQANPNRFPDDYLIPHREMDADCPDCGGKVDRVQVSGRSAYYCPSCQRRPS